MYLEASQYNVLSYIGCGSDHTIYKVENSLTQELCAIKIEKSAGIGQIKNEIEMLKKLQGISGIPELKSYGITSDNKLFIIVPLFQYNLKEVAKEKQLSLSQILRIGLRMTEILENIHCNNVLHLDLKPENIMFSKQIQDDQNTIKPEIIQLIDFGLSQKFNQNSTFLKDTFIGSLSFASRQSHNGEQLGFKDDLESLIYILVYLRNQKLPWLQKPSWGCKKVDIQIIGKVKTFHYNSQTLYSNFPLGFQDIMQYIDTLKYYVMPDYSYIKSLFLKMLQPYSSFFQTKQISSFQNVINTSIILYNPNEQNSEEDIISCETKYVLISKVISKYATNQIKSISHIQS
ncbi:unnamed protein product [Paramecium sonneborni]|uniref:Casein kinase I n=1 Tax=Paramecium sonneborni TaxID=65129 RepID=A0A8S1MHA0_9CILI|nr:unnamed protein product [Paramecium sonneborni]